MTIEVHQTNVSGTCLSVGLKKKKNQISEFNEMCIHVDRHFPCHDSKPECEVTS